MRETTDKERERLGLPIRIFLYTLDQISDLLQVHNVDKYLYYEGRSTGTQRVDQLQALNIAPAGTVPEWRVDEREFIRWCKHKKVSIYKRVI